MILTLAASALLAAPALQDQPASRTWEIPDSAGVARFLVAEQIERMDPPKKCPKHGWMYEWAVGGLARESGGSTPFRAKVRVFSQQRKQENDPAGLVARMILRLWDLNYRKLKIDHSPIYNNGIVDIYMAFGGKAGGEQLFTGDVEGGADKKVNVIYIYASQTFTDSLEMAREVAHEYGHATLPQIGGFKVPEDWAAGFLGERLYLKWAAEELAAGRFVPGDVMGAGGTQLSAFVKREVEPLIAQAATLGPDTALLRRPGAASMNAYIGLALWAETMLPSNVFARSLKLTGSTSAADYVRAIVTAADEPDNYLVNIPPYLAGRQVWVPLGKGRLSGNVGIVKRRGDWALIDPGQSAVRVINRT